MTAATDDFTGPLYGLDGPANNAVLVSPDDANDLGHVSRALYLGTGGDLKVTMKGGQTLVIPSLSAGWHPLRATRVWATSTTASNITAVW